MWESATWQQIILALSHTLFFCNIPFKSSLPITSFWNRHKEIIFFFYTSLRGHRHYWFLQNSLQAILQCMQELLRAWTCTRFPLVVQTKCFFLLSSSLSYRMCCYTKSLLLVFRKVHHEWFPTENFWSNLWKCSRWPRLNLVKNSFSQWKIAFIVKYINWHSLNLNHNEWESISSVH